MRHVLVGPRPHPVEDCARYSSEDCRRPQRETRYHRALAGHGRSNPSFEICIDAGSRLYPKMSFFLDCRILLKTIPAVLVGEGQ